MYIFVKSFSGDSIPLMEGSPEEGTGAAPTAIEWYLLPSRREGSGVGMFFKPLSAGGTQKR